MKPLSECMGLFNSGRFSAETAQVNCSYLMIGFEMPRAVKETLSK
jgi:hypothetical protein